MPSTTVSLKNKLETPEDYVLDLGYYAVLESHIERLKKNAAIIDVKPHIADVYIGDFDGLLTELGYRDKKFHYLIRRVNGLDSSGKYDGIKTELLIPNVSEMSAIFSIYTSRID